MKRMAGLLALYVLGLSLVSLGEFWREGDMWLVARSGLLGKPAPLNQRLVIIDIPLTGGSKDRAQERHAIASALNLLAREPKPDAVVLDIDISDSPGGLDALYDAIEQIRKEEIDFYAAANPSAEGMAVLADSSDPSDQSMTPDYYEGKASIYDDVPHGHTIMKSLHGVLWYDASFTLWNQTIEALPIVIDNKGEMTGEQGERLVRLGSEAERERIAWNFKEGVSGGGAFQSRSGDSPEQPILDDAVVILGSLSKRDFNRYVDRFGMEILAWAINDRLANVSTHPRVIQGPGWVVGATTLMSLVVMGLFRESFRRLPSQRRRLWLLGTASVVATVLIFAGLVWVLKLAGNIYPQWSLVLAGIALSAGLTGYALSRQLVRDALKRDMESSERIAADQYDVFISYSRTPENLKWVSEHVYPALAAAKRADGSPLRVFFDKDSIHLGTSWYEKLALAIQGSRYFVPVYSKDYFEKGFCRFEMELAAIRRVHEPNFILPLARVTTGVPAGYQQINFIDVSEQPDYLEKVLEIVRREPAQARESIE